MAIGREGRGSLVFRAHNNLDGFKVPGLMRVHHAAWMYSIPHQNSHTLAQPISTAGVQEWPTALIPPLIYTKHRRKCPKWTENEGNRPNLTEIERNSGYLGQFPRVSNWPEKTERDRNRPKQTEFSLHLMSAPRANSSLQNIFRHTLHIRIHFIFN